MDKHSLWLIAGVEIWRNFSVTNPPHHHLHWLLKGPSTLSTSQIYWRALWKQVHVPDYPLMRSSSHQMIMGHRYWWRCTDPFSSWHNCPRQNICWIFHQSFLPKNPAWVEKSSESGYCMGSVSLNVNKSYHKRKARKRHTTASIWFCQSAWKLEKKNFLSNATNKKELFSFLSTSNVQTLFQDGK